MNDSAGMIAQVVPDLPTFAVDDGFAYEIPTDLRSLHIGSIVRIPLGSRRVRGYVVSTRTGDTTALKPVISVSGDYPVFHEALLQTLRWAALHYVAPLSVLLGRAAPPNLPRGKGAKVAASVPELTSPIAEVSSHAAAGKRLRPTAYITGGPYAADIGAIASGVVAAGRNVAVVVATVEEAERIAADLREDFGDRVLYVSSAVPAKEATRSWVTATRAESVLIVGTPEIALWPLGDPALWIVVEEGRRAMKSKQTPTLQVRDLVRRRGLVERSTVVFLGPVPTLDTLARGAAITEPPGRVWPLVELMDRREDPPGGKSLAPRTVHAIRRTAKAGGRVFVFVSRRGYAPAFRCVRCRELRRCSECGAGPDRGDNCKRCGTELGSCSKCGGRRFEPLGAGMGRVAEELQRHLGAEHVGPVQSGRQITVGSERDLPYVPETALTVAVDADSLLMAPNYRAEDDAFRLLSRVALTVARGRGRRCLIQTGQPQHRALTALSSGHPMGLLNGLNLERERDHLPPSASLIAVEVGGDATSHSADIEMLAAEGIQVHGPETGGERTRWFIQGESIHGSRVQLRSVVQRWRDSGLKVRIDADPIDL